MLENLRMAFYRFVRDNIAPSVPVEKPDIGVVGFDEGVTNGQYAGEVSIPPSSGVTDATALALLLSAQWVAAFAEREGMTRTVLKTSDFRFVVKWTVEFQKAEVGESAIVADPEGIRASIESLMDAVEPSDLDDLLDDHQEDDGRKGVVLSIHSARSTCKNANTFTHIAQSKICSTIND